MNLLEVIPTFTNVLFVDSSLINTRYKDLGNLSIFFFLSCDFLTNFNST